MQTVSSKLPTTSGKPLKINRPILSVQIIKIINQNHGQGNDFLVTKNQVDKLKKVWNKKLSPYDWLKVVTGVDTFFRNKWFSKERILKRLENKVQLILYPNKLHGREQVYKDHIHRAKHIVKHMITSKQKHIVTMDGHGRFIMCFLRELVRQGEPVQDYTITLLDIDHTTNEWHHLFLPTNVNVVSGNILETTYDHNNVCMYLNFCSIGKNSEKLAEFIKNKKNFFLSFTERGFNNEKDKGISSVVSSVKSIGIFISSRGLFYTYHIP